MSSPPTSSFNTHIAEAGVTDGMLCEYSLGDGVLTTEDRCRVWYRCWHRDTLLHRDRRRPWGILSRHRSVAICSKISNWVRMAMAHCSVGHRTVWRLAIDTVRRAIGLGLLLHHLVDTLRAGFTVDTARTSWPATSRCCCGVSDSFVLLELLESGCLGDNIRQKLQIIKSRYGSSLQV